MAIPSWALDPPWRTTVSISIGDGLHLAVKEQIGFHPKLALEYPYSGVCTDLGPFTRRRIDELIEYLGRLRIHADDAGG